MHSGQTSWVTQGRHWYCSMHTCWGDKQTDVGEHKKTNRAEVKRIYTASVAGVLSGDSTG